MNSLSNTPGEIHEDTRQVVAVEVEPDGIRAIRVDLEAGRRRAASLRARVALADEAEREQLADEIRHRLARQLGMPGNFGARQRSVEPDHLVDDPEIELLGIDEVRSGQHSDLFVSVLRARVTSAAPIWL